MVRVPGSDPTNVVSSNCSSTNTSVLLSIPNPSTEAKLLFSVSVVGKAAVPFSGTSSFHTRAFVMSAETVALQGKLPATGSLKQLVLSTSDAYSEIAVGGGDPLPLLDKVEVMVFWRIVALVVNKSTELRLPPNTRLASPG